MSASLDPRRGDGGWQVALLQSCNEESDVILNRTNSAGAATSAPPDGADWPSYFKSLSDLDPATRNEKLLDLVKAGAFDFIDFGTHKGGGLLKGVSHLHGKLGLGVEMNDAKVRALLADGYAALCSDILEFRPPGRPFKFAVCRHILEHMPSEAVVEAVLKKLGELCTGYIFIEQPSFDYDAELAKLGFTLASSTLDYHTCRMTKADFSKLLRGLGFRRFVVAEGGLVADSLHKSILRSDTPKNRGRWIEGRDLEKTVVQFQKPIYRHNVVVISLSEEIDPEDILKLGYGTDVRLMATEEPAL